MKLLEADSAQTDWQEAAAALNRALVRAAEAADTVARWPVTDLTDDSALARQPVPQVRRSQRHRRHQRPPDRRHARSPRPQPAPHRGRLLRLHHLHPLAPQPGPQNQLRLTASCHMPFLPWEFRPVSRFTAVLKIDSSQKILFLQSCHADHLNL